MKIFPKKAQVQIYPLGGASLSHQRNSTYESLADLTSVETAGVERNLAIVTLIGLETGVDSDPIRYHPA